MHTSSTDTWSQRLFFSFAKGSKTSDCKAIKYENDYPEKVVPKRRSPFFRSLKTPKLDLSAVSSAYEASSIPVDSPDSPPPPDGCHEREVRRALLKLPGKPKRVKNLFIALLAAGPQVSTPLVEKIAQTIAEDSAALLFAVSLISGTDEHSGGAISPPRAPVSVSGPPRERLRLPWAISNFILAGPPVLKEAVVNSKECLLNLTQVFTRINYDPARAAFAAGIIIAAINENPRMTANVVANNRDFIKALVSRIDSAPAMDILIRLCGTRDFTLHDHGAVVPAHKRSIASLYKFKIYKLLVEKFQHHSELDKAHRPDSQIVCSHITQVIAEMHSRALVIPKKWEDPDERYDAFGISHLNIISPSVYNDALDYLCLVLVADSPLIHIIDIAINSSSNHVKVCALELAAKAFKALANARKSRMPLVSSAAKARKTAKFMNAFAKKVPAILNLLGDANTSARARTACVDTLCEFMDIAELGTLKEIMMKHKTLDALLEFIKTRPHDNMNTLRITKTIVNMMNSCNEAAAKWTLLLQYSSLLEYLRGVEDEECGGHLRECIDCIIKMVKVDDGTLDAVSDSRRKITEAIAARHGRHRRERAAGLFKEEVSERQDSKTWQRELALADKKMTMIASEDKGKLLYAKSFARGKTNSNSDHTTILEAVFSRRSRP